MRGSVRLIAGVVQAFRTTTQLERAERCLFVPVKLVDFTNPGLVDRWPMWR